MLAAIVWIAFAVACAGLVYFGVLGALGKPNWPVLTAAAVAASFLLFVALQARWLRSRRTLAEEGRANLSSNDGGDGGGSGRPRWSTVAWIAAIVGVLSFLAGLFIDHGVLHRVLLGVAILAGLVVVASVGVVIEASRRRNRGAT
ncbi:hypothetical protein N136_02497 [Leifsonia aquatica ATCC 14665]|uniref:Uncharacterized protein n=1 Tax=Leifsonia aquatica ATCC 14665 TaxID=1358026 RepID=U2RQN6_LEIAQ|nr:hypothetical protein N136_02497 [Leifsonia aquatica ATCC 14665]